MWDGDFTTGSEITLTELNEQQAEDIEARLGEHELEHIKCRLPGCVSVGAFCGGRLIAGAYAMMTAYKILYVSTVFVDADFRRKGVGRRLMSEIERRALMLGANTIRLDTFNWQGPEFYREMGYEQVGFYTVPEDGYSEYFFIKRL